MQIILCGIARKENLYINEWCKYHLALGFDHIYLYDNNDSDYPYVGDCIDKELLDKITIVDWRKRHDMAVLSKAYLDCYKNNVFDWCAFWDIDEFLVGIPEIHEFFNTNKFDKIEQIRLMWEWFGDDEALERDVSQPVMEFFKIKLTDAHHNVGKFILKSGVAVEKIDPHLGFGIANRPLITCFPSGKCSQASAVDRYIKPQGEYQKTETVYLNHYMTKTLKEFLDQKYMTPDVMMQPTKLGRGLDYFWHLNKKTPEKLDYINKYLKNKKYPWN